MTICFVIAPQNKGWILDRIAHEVGDRLGDALYCYDPSNPPEADRYFVTHYSLLPAVLSKVNPAITPVTCFYTHNKGNLKDYVPHLNQCHSVIAERPDGVTELEYLGVLDTITHCVPECADPKRFIPHERGSGGILVSGRNYPDGRKGTGLLKGVVRFLPNRTFHFVGVDWEKDIEGDNVVLHKSPEYADYPRIYAGCDVYLSCSKLEGGGPNSLIESMHANLIPVISDTGNAREYIVSGYNGFVFGQTSTAEDVAKLIERAYSHKPQLLPPYNDVWASVQDFNYDWYGKRMKEILSGVYQDSTL